jgi:sigma-B regulation protein RsbU (phosphoserine phosphatase)
VVPSPLDSATIHICLPDDADQQRTYEVRREPLRDPRGRAAGNLVILRDVTERTRADEMLAQLLVERSRVAAQLQQSLVPGDLPRIPGMEIAGRYEPAGDGHEIGGDFFDVFALDDDVWGIVLGDVSGKGAEAATVTALARYTLRALANPGHQPSHTLRDLNRRMLADTELERHCTLVYALVRPLSDPPEVTLSLAGHHPPLIARHTGLVEPAGELGTALGLFEQAEWHDTHVVLEPGDLLCLFTDGLVEARQDGDLFGSERVATILSGLHEQPLQELADELVAAPRRFHGPELADDLAVLLLRALRSAEDADPATWAHGEPGVGTRASDVGKEEGQAP